MSSNLIKLASKRAEMQVTKTCTATTRESIGRKGSANFRQSKTKQSLVFFGKQLHVRAWAIKDENHEDYAAERFEYLKLCPNLPNRFYSTHTNVKRKRRRGKTKLAWQDNGRSWSVDHTWASRFYHDMRSDAVSQHFYTKTLKTLTKHRWLQWRIATNKHTWSRKYN